MSHITVCVIDVIFFCWLAAVLLAYSRNVNMLWNDLGVLTGSVKVSGLVPLYEQLCSYNGISIKKKSQNI